MSERPSDNDSGGDRSDLLRLGGVGVLAVVLALIGFSIASRFEPSTGPGPVLAGGSQETTTTIGFVTSTSTPPVDTPPTQPGQEATTTTTPAAPATLALSQEVLDFGSAEDSLQLQISHTSGGAAAWELSADNQLVNVEPSSGTIEPGSTATVSVSVDRSQIPEGDFEAALTLNWADGEANAGVVAVFEDNPIIHSPQVSPGTVQVGGCSPSQTTISARVRDSSELERVIARWSSDGSTVRETAMEAVGNDIYQGVIGPYEVIGNDNVKVVAFDVRGNAGGASVTLTVTACA